eukprot:6181017-Pleurochrysis_carterae.AAC.3
MSRSTAASMRTSAATLPQALGQNCIRTIAILALLVLACAPEDMRMCSTSRMHGARMLACEHMYTHVYACPQMLRRGRSIAAAHAWHTKSASQRG